MELLVMHATFDFTCAMEFAFQLQESERGTIMKDLTSKLRILNAGLFVLVILTGLVGWIGFERDPMQLVVLIGALTATTGIGEASNVGKRATYNPDAI